MAERNLVKFPPGTVIFTEGGVDYKMYLIRDGWVKVSKGRRTIAQLGPGEPVGEMSLLLDEPHSATVKAVSDVEAIEIPNYGAGLDVIVSDVGGEISVVAIGAGFDPDEAVNLYLIAAGPANKDITLESGIRPNTSGAFQRPIALSKFVGVDKDSYTVVAVGSGGSIASAGIYWKG